jgi:hypothetical protein
VTSGARTGEHAGLLNLVGDRGPASGARRCIVHGWAGEPQTLFSWSPRATPRWRAFMRRRCVFGRGPLPDVDTRES